MKKYLVICMVLCTLLLVACQAKTPEKSIKSKQSEPVHLEKAVKLKIGTAYRIGKSSDLNAFYIKLIDDKHCVYMLDESQYTEKQIEEKSGDGDHFYPYISLTEGEYSKDGDDYILKPTRTQKIEFKDAKHAKDKIIATQKIQDSDPQDVFAIEKKDGVYSWC
ncbi:Uncharacterised protein [Streptococcus criceti]|uniref:Lipoprotein n=2 Tax=Streptococcus criceti TaxID=1333 RepID=G5JRN8_STRCG|nr:hypothetical protein [Streptococcus criceti]EHI74525.1 putative lipoprotein [Streptococcus criceti HS-6]SUN42872.1 Uncharacterised protein [Streptococcus criceti]BAE93410.1 hypothetical protein [Streptococcus criceti]BAM63279.1 hypothetical protein [Streptococcus criceti]BAM63282.1 hypothetical protein [Streptococcus criceti]